jgi:hypothetical protein
MEYAKKNNSFANLIPSYFTIQYIQHMESSTRHYDPCVIKQNDDILIPFTLKTSLVVN